jgi:hypothetical protein
MRMVNSDGLCPEKYDLDKYTYIETFQQRIEPYGEFYVNVSKEKGLKIWDEPNGNLYISKAVDLINWLEQNTSNNVYVDKINLTSESLMLLLDYIKFLENELNKEYE